MIREMSVCSRPVMPAGSQGKLLVITGAAKTLCDETKPEAKKKSQQVRMRSRIEYLKQNIQNKKNK